MVFTVLALLALVSSQNYPAENKPEKFNACYYLTKLKLTIDKELFDGVIGRLGGNGEKVGNRISTDMLMKCYGIITLDTSMEVLQQGENLIYQDSYDELIGVDLNSYEPENIELQPEHLAFYEEIKKMKEEAEIAAEKGPAQAPPLPPVGAWYIIVVIAIFGAFFYWASSKVLTKQEKPAKKDRKNKKKN